MRRLVAFSLVICVAAGGCGRSSTPRNPQAKQAAPPQKASAPVNQAQSDELIVGRPVRYQNLTIFPVSSRVPRNDDRYITLEEGLAAGTVEIFEVRAIDVFGSTPLFRKLWPTLLKSHALDAANAADAAEAKNTCKLDDAKTFLHNAMQADVEKKSEAQGGLVVTQRKSKGVVSFSAAEESNAKGMGMGSFGGAVHSAAFAE